jgi:hypothetical protein
MLALRRMRLDLNPGERRQGGAAVINLDQQNA